MLGFWVSLFLHVPLLFADDCLLKSDVNVVSQQFIFEDFKEGQWGPLSTWNLCHSQTVAYKVFKSIIDLKKLPPLKAQMDGFDQNAISGSPFQFFAERVEKIRFDTNPKSTHCRAGVTGTMAYVLDSYSNTMHVCPFADQFSQLQMHGTLIHEARHLLQKENYGNEKAEYRKLHGSSSSAYAHVTCESGFFSSGFNCDASIDDHGSYGIEMEFYLKLARTPGLPSDLRKKAKGMALDGYLGHFNQIPDGQLGLLLESQDGDVVFYNPETHATFDILNDLNPQWVLTDRFTPTFFDPVLGVVKSYAGPMQFVETNGSYAQQFRDMPLEQMHKLRDVVYGFKNQCALFSDSVICSNGQSQVTLHLPQDSQPLHFTIIRLLDMDLFFIVDVNGHHTRLPMELPYEAWTLKDLQATPSFDHFLGVAMMPGLQRYALKMDGTLVKYETVQDLEPIEALAGRRFKKIIGPYLWSQKLQEL